MQSKTSNQSSGVELDVLNELLAMWMRKHNEVVGVLSIGNRA